VHGEQAQGSHAVQKSTRLLISSFKPADDLRGQDENVTHERDLSTALCEIVLVDTKQVDPQKAQMARLPNLGDSIKEVLRNVHRYFITQDRVAP
jgi:hypothetical protein